LLFTTKRLAQRQTNLITDFIGGLLVHENILLEQPTTKKRFRTVETVSPSLPRIGKAHLQGVGTFKVDYTPNTPA